MNIVLIGMPGCGKSSIGLALSRLTGRPLFDTDIMVATAAGQSIPAIFEQYGEEAFRQLEQEAIEEAAAHSNSIIASGGGAVLREENCRALGQNGRFYFIERDLHSLPTTGRPLSVDLGAMYKERQPIYRRLAYAIINNNGSIEEAAKNVLEASLI